MATKNLPAPSQSTPFSPSSAVYHIANDTLKRLGNVISQVEHFAIAIVCLLPSVQAQIGDPYASSFNATTSDDPKVQEDVISMVDLFDFWAWKHRGNLIRDGNSRRECAGNLSLALSELGTLFSAETGGASGALSLLPTAGALIGAPAKELWVLYKLMPLAGVMSMLLSLGGNIVPLQSSDYEVKTQAFTYGGMIATSHHETEKANYYDDDGEECAGSDAQKFANIVERRAHEPRGSRKRFTVAIGVCIQLFWLVVLVSACWFTQSGGVISWWCQNWGWMYFWYGSVVLSSLLENYAGVPFSKQWTIRVSRAPKVRISEDAPLVAQTVTEAVLDSESLLQETPPAGSTGNAGPAFTSGYTEDRMSIPRKPVGMEATTTPLGGLERSSTSLGGMAPLHSTPTDLLRDLDMGYNTIGRVIMDPNEPWSAPRVPFYVIISLEGITTPHAVLRVISKAISVGVFAAGTATFASATLITISVALTVLCLVLGAGVFGRVVAMWMVSEMMKTDPVLHRVTKDRAKAAEYMTAILSKPGLTCELMGHIIVNGRCIKRYNKWLQWNSLFGILAPPFDVTSLAVRHARR